LRGHVHFRVGNRTVQQDALLGGHSAEARRRGINICITYLQS
jgi:hypothetical protein